jgi:uncharacterized repeat protein (TIGR01451 family)
LGSLHRLLIAVVALLALLAVTTPADAAFPGSNGKLLYTGSPMSVYSSSGAYTAIYGGPACCARWSPDGQKIAFSGNGSLHVMNADGSGDVDLGVAGDSPAWSPDGTKLAFAHRDSFESTWGIYITTLNGATISGPLCPGINTLSEPAWSPDGAMIAFTETPDGFRWIRIVNANGSNCRTLVQGDNSGLDNSHPDWSPDSTRIVFSHAFTSSHGTTNNNLGIVPAAGGAITTISDNQYPWTPTWSPDGTRIAATGAQGTALMNPDGSNRVAYNPYGAAPSGPGVNRLDWQSVHVSGANLSTAITDSPDPVYTGEVLTYRVAVKNVIGPETATETDLTVDLPGSVTFLGSSPSQGTCSAAGQQVSCHFGDLPDGMTTTADIRVEAQSAGTATVSGAATSTTNDPDPVNNQATESTTVNNVVGYARPKGASPLRVPLVPAYVACTGPNRSHGSPLSYPSCAPPLPVSPYLTVGTTDANGQAANSVGYARFDVIAGDPATAQDEADAGIRFSLTDVRNRGPLTDYVGQLEARTDVRITDRLNGSPSVFPATVNDWTLRMTTPCSATASTAVGATCSLNTTVEALIPGALTEGKRAIWELGQFRVFDGGEDGVVSTDDNVLFAKQGIFVP